jgi:hypothetical protein
MSKGSKRGGYRKHEFGELVKADPACAAKRLQETWLQAGGSKLAATRLGISKRTFFRYVDVLDAAGFPITAPTTATERHRRKSESILGAHDVRKSSESDRNRP